MELIWNMVSACVKLALATVEQRGEEWEYVRRYELLDPTPMYYIPIKEVLPVAFHHLIPTVLCDVMAGHPEVVVDVEGGWLKIPIGE